MAKKQWYNFLIGTKIEFKKDRKNQDYLLDHPHFGNGEGEVVGYDNEDYPSQIQNSNVLIKVKFENGETGSFFADRAKKSNCSEYVFCSEYVLKEVDNIIKELEKNNKRSKRKS
jgi:hypothetical protein